MMGHDNQPQPAKTPRGSGKEDAKESWMVEADHRLDDPYSGTIQVQPGVFFEITNEGQHQGPLVFQAGSVGRITGDHVGALALAGDSTVEIQGTHNGPVEVDEGAVLQVAAGGRISGHLEVAGLVENRGVRAGNVVLAGGEIHDIEGGLIEPPVITRVTTPDED